jgi:hypothetical protein
MSTDYCHCHFTALAGFPDGPAVLAHAIAPQTGLHARLGGAVTAVAGRAHVRRLLPFSGGCRPSFPSTEAGGGVGLQLLLSVFS